MGIYITINFAIILLGLFYESIFLRDSMTNRIKKLPRYFFIIPSFLLLFSISSFRGDFNVDYKNYSYLFELYNRFDFLESLQYTNIEKGYIFLSRLVGAFTDSAIYLFATTTFIILLCFYSQFNKHSTYIWLSVLMFVTIGSFYPSFNIMRQILASAIVFSGSTFLYERKFFKYFLVIMLASLFHVTSLIMLVFYFILNFKFSFRNIFFVLFSSVLIILFLDVIIMIIQTYYYTSYVEGAYGMEGASFKIAILPISFVVFSIINYKKINLDDIVQRVWLNAIIFYAVFSILGTKVFMIERLTYFFSPYALLLIPMLFSKIISKDLRVISIIGLTFLLVSYNFVVFSGTDYDPYYFIWEAHQHP